MHARSEGNATHAHKRDVSLFVFAILKSVNDTQRLFFIFFFHSRMTGVSTRRVIASSDWPPFVAADM